MAAWPQTISIHAPREGCDGDIYRLAAKQGYFNPRTPRGVRLIATPLRQVIKNHTISIHAPREGCDACASDQAYHPVRFQSTHPARGATEVNAEVFQLVDISIHAPREGCDSTTGGAVLYDGGFQSTHPARGATERKPASAWPPRFQSTHPARGATANFTKEQRVCLAQFAYLHKGKKAEHTKTNAPMLHEAFLYAFWVRTGRRRRVLLDFARYKIKGSSGR